MDWLLKIVEGPMKGAEIALVEGFAVSFGSGDDCDIVVHDATVPARACELEAGASGVSITVGGGEAEVLPAFEVRSFGTTAFAVGPTDGEWEALVRPVAPAFERPDSENAASERAASSADAEDAATGRGNDGGTDKPGRSRRSGCLLWLVLLLLFIVAVVLAWWFWPKVAEKCPWAENARVVCVEKARTWLGAKNGQGCPEKRKSGKGAKNFGSPKFSLAELAESYGLALTNNSQSSVDCQLLSGNLKRRTERLAIRALALAADPNVKFDLTDDETLFSASTELIFACSDGALKVDAATNRVVTLSGYAPSALALEKALRALDADVKGIERLDTSRVHVGGTPPAEVAATPFVREKAPGEYPVVVIPAHTPEAPLPRKKAARDYPIAGILTIPYPCVVLRNGERLLEGAQIGKAELVKIETDRLTLKDDGQEVVWKP